MPELPEIETIKRSLEPHIAGCIISGAEILLPRQLQWPETAEAFVQRVRGRKITGMGRIGKYLLVHLEAELELVFHLRMTGQLVYVPAGTEYVNKHTRMSLHFADGARLVFNDLRTFGVFEAIYPDEREKLHSMYAMGPEPLSAGFTEKYLTERLAGRRTKVKSLLLDQNVIAGLGNIYVDEALFLAGVQPVRQAGTVTAEEISHLHKAINKVIADGIADGGTTFRDYRDGNGNKGDHQNHLYAYGRGGEPCQACGTIMEKTKVGGRGTCYCPQCQK